MSGGHDLMIRTGRCLVVSKTGIVHELGLFSSSLAKVRGRGVVEAGRGRKTSEQMVVGGLLILYTC
jgi:hypothetical protein